MLFIYLLAAFIVIILIVASAMPSKYNIEKNIIVQKPVTTVMKYVGDLNVYSTWNPWQQMEKDAKKTITGTPLTQGHAYAWEGKKIGKGLLTLSSTDERHIHFNLEFLKPWKSNAKDNWLFEQWGNDETKVTWQNSGELPWPVARLLGPSIIKNLNHQFEKGLQNLKKLCEGV